MYAMVLFIIFGMFAFSYNTTKDDKPKYYQVVQLFEDNQVSEYNLNLANGKLQYKLFTDNENAKVHVYSVPNVTMFKEDIHEHVMEYNKEHPDAQIKADYAAGATGSWLSSMLPMLLITGVLIGLSIYFMKKMSQTVANDTNKTLSFGKARVQQKNGEKAKVTFNDVAGADEEKEELSEIVEFLKSPTRYNELGARIPKGVLLVGPPGTGKTLLARAVAGEADVPFFYLSGSDFVEMYVGVGASRVRDLFDKAKKKSPAIVFIDEIDAVGRQRGAGMGGGNDEREQTLNQLLVEMDGFGVNEGVIVLAATNRSDVLDPALTRPGRFDRQVMVGYPDLQGREDILKVHARNKPLAPDVDLKVIASATAGFTGADLENLLNEAALLAAKSHLKAITMREIQDAMIKVMVGTEKKSRKYTKKDKSLTAYHEAGHAVASYYLKDQDPVREISIIPRGQAGGYNLSIPVEDRNYISKNYMLEEIISLLGGRAAEELFMDDISSGASNDIERATEIARNMITKYGMSKKLGPITFNGGGEVFLGRDYSQTRSYSEFKAQEIDNEIHDIITNAYEHCKNIINEHRDQLERVAKYLIRHEKMNGERFVELMEDTYQEQADDPDALSKQQEEQLQNIDKQEQEFQSTIFAPAADDESAPEGEENTPNSKE